MDWGAFIASGLTLANQILASTIVLTSFSLFVYLLIYSFRSPVARAFGALLVFCLVVYACDIVLYEASETSVERWLKIQWIGIALVTAAYLHFSDAVLSTTNLRAAWRRAAVAAAYLLSAGFVTLVFFSPWVVYDGVFAPQKSHLAAGPLFWVFALYFFLILAWGAANIQRARRRCLTRASRRRMAYLGLAFAGPGLGVFPYVLLTSLPLALPTNVLLLLVLAGNVSVLAMMVVMTYSVAYFGSLTPDRVIKHTLIRYLLRGPLVGTVVIFTMLTIPRVQRIIGLPRDTVLIFAVVGVIVFMQMAVNWVRPMVDRVVYRQDQEEMSWIQTLDRRLLTTADLRGLLENTLAALCDLLQVRTAFVAVPADGEYRIEAHCGARALAEAYLARHPRDAAEEAPGPNGDGARPLAVRDGFWLAPLDSPTSGARLGILGIQARGTGDALAASEKEIASLLVERAREVLEDRYLQLSVFDTLRHILPNIERLQRWRSATRYAGSAPVEIVQDSPVYSPEFQQWVKDALSHYWGGPKLTESPLLNLGVVQAALREHGGNPAYALRAVLTDVIEGLRPDGERRLTTAEWILYNILEMRFIRGLKVKDIAGRLAMSESDLYRKQRVAINQVARALADLEETREGSGAPAPARATMGTADGSEGGNRGREVQ